MAPGGGWLKTEGSATSNELVLGWNLAVHGVRFSVWFRTSEWLFFSFPLTSFHPEVDVLHPVVMSFRKETSEGFLVLMMST